MKIEEAIEILENGGWWELLVPITTVEGRSDEDKLHQAVDMAITALRSMPEAGEPFHIDRSKWKPCEFCNGKTVLYQHTNSTKLFMNTFGKAATLVTECNACPPYADCCMKDISANSAFT